MRNPDYNKKPVSRNNYIARDVNKGLSLRNSRYLLYSLFNKVTNNLSLNCVIIRGKPGADILINIGHYSSEFFALDGREKNKIRGKLVDY